MDLIIINGLPATGKTTIATVLSERLNIPIVAKDTIKEFLFDTLGVKDRDWSRKLGMISSDFMYVLADALLTEGQSFIIENAFEQSFAKPQLEALIGKYNPRVIELHCTTERAVRRTRFIERNEGGERHTGHMDHTNYLADDENEPIDKFAPLELTGGKILTIDTTIPDSVDFDEIIKLVRS